MKTVPLTLLAFAVVYFVRGSTYLAIRVGVGEVPPFLFAAMCFLAAGAILFAWSISRGDRLPTARQWLSALYLAILIFPFDYGLLFWAEQRVPSGVAAVIMATIPCFIAISEALLLRTVAITPRVALALAAGLAGVAVLTLRSFDLGGLPVDRLGAAAILFASVCWAVSTSLTRILPLPPSKSMNSGAQMLVGGLLLVLAAAALGEFPRFHPEAVSARAWLSLAYLTIPGSVIGFTAYLWLLHRHSPTKVGTYAYVNPVVAVVIGRLFGGEPLGPRTAAGTALVLIGVLLTLTAPAQKVKS